MCEYIKKVLRLELVYMLIHSHCDKRLILIAFNALELSSVYHQVNF